MSALPHPTGRNRAYKKIRGREYQIYCSTLEKAQLKQQELDSLASLKPTRLFWSDGKMIGVSIRKDTRPERARSVYFKLQILGNNKTIIYRDDFDFTWSQVKSRWIEMRELNLADLTSYRTEIERARIIYSNIIRAI